MIVKMSKLKLAGLLTQRNAVVRRLMQLGAVEITALPLSEDEQSEVLQYAQYDDATDRINEIEEELRKINSAIAFLDALDVGKTSKKQTMSFESFVNPDTYKGAWEKVFNANSLKSDIASKKADINNTRNNIDRLALWTKYTMPLQYNGTRETSFVLGTIPSAVDFDAVEKVINDTPSHIERIDSDSENHYVYLLSHNSCYDWAVSKLKEFGFTPAEFEGLNGTVETNINMYQAELAKHQKQLQQLQDAAIKAADDLQAIRNLYDYIYNMQQRRRVRGNFLKTQNTFLIGGWVAADSVEKIRQGLSKDFDVALEFYEPAAGEETPVMFKNNKFIHPFEVVTDMYALPLSTSVDPNFIMGPFFWLFFGMMLGDAVYGLLMIALGAYAIWKLKLEGTVGQIMQLVFACGFSTFAFGALTGTWMGDFAQSALGINVPYLFDPLTDPMTLLYISFALGFIHIVCGLGMKAWLMIRGGNLLHAIFDVGFWYLVLFGLVIFALGAVLLGSDIVSAIGMYMLIGGVVGLIATQGRGSKSVVAKFFVGLLSLYDITGYMSDILSYARILALGLATSVISQVFNTMGLMFGGFTSIIGAIALIAVALVGHTFNIAINILGSFVHSARLQYIEFYGKFYESGGAPFKPLKTTTKYVKIVD